MWFEDVYHWAGDVYRRIVQRTSRTFKGVDPYKVVFSCFGGRSYGDSTRCISERLHERCPEAKIIWQFNHTNLERARGMVPDYVRTVRCRSVEACVEFATARVWVDNFSKPEFMELDSRRQYYVQTWHGDRAISGGS